jgi:hypothetical protein
VKRSEPRLWQPRRDDHAGRGAGSIRDGRYRVGGRNPAAAQRWVPRPIGRSTLWDGGAEPTAVERARQPTGGERSDTRSGSGAPRRSGSSSAGRDGRVDAAGERPTGTPRRLRPAGGSTPGSADPGGSTPPRRRPRPRRGHPPLWWRLIAVHMLVLLTMISRLPHGRLATGSADISRAGRRRCTDGHRRTGSTGATFTAAAPSGAMSGSEAAIASAVSAGA